MTSNKRALLSLRAIKPQRRRRAVRIAVVACCLAVLPSLAIAGAVARAATAAPDPAVVRISDGLIRGAVTASYRKFEGIPYAAPPVGDLRWRPPQQPAPWKGVRDATQPGSQCPQQAPRGSAAVTGKEDCLFLNVTTPLPGPPAVRLPVMVFIHGGGVSGTGSSYDTTRLTTQGNVITVTIDYRIGALGFLDIPQLAARDPYAGNYGLADQQAALRWVQRNIAAFGGDPGNVTLFGESAGGASVCANLAAPGSRGLFQKAIVESAPCANPLPSARAATQASTRVAAELGCTAQTNMLACLRDKPAAGLVQGPTATVGPGTPAAGEPWFDAAGTPALPQQPLTALRDGTAARVPLIQGSNQDEMRVLVAGWYDQQGAPLTAGQYPAVLTEAFGSGRAQQVARQYPLSRYPSPDIALATVLTDWGELTGACPVLPADDAASRRAPVYAYEFAQDDGLSIGTFPMGATHGSELPYLFGTMRNFPPPDPALSRQMISYWTTFARTGNPSSPQTPYWPAYRPGDQVILSLAAVPGGITPVAFAAEHHCGFWGDR